MTCDAKQRSIALPIIEARSDASSSPAPRPRSRMGWKRAIVLGGIQLILIAHLVQWLRTGTTITPMEPSESMATVKDGIVNVGTVVFALALVSTLVLGRWFCGWACHIVMLQDLCFWMLGKLGIRPHAFRSRLLLFLPLALALYMFVWPLVYRFAVAPFTQPALAWPGFTAQFVTRDFWQTFPGAMVAIPFLLVCGFLAVYLLGAKGYCTYGCPYGGFFAPLDEFAIGRIRVTDACEHCGHCTSVCTSNVRVHEEVKDFGMVVDPGCMKCMDCVDVCPNDALYFGFGAPAVARTQRATSPARSFDMSLREEIAFAIVALVAFIGVRGSVGLSLPLLFASGVTICITFMAWKAWRTLCDENASFHRFRLRFHGSLKPAGVAWIAMTAIVLLVALQSATVNAMGSIAGFCFNRVTVPPATVYSGAPFELDPPMALDAERALKLYDLASSMRSGGIALLPVQQFEIDMRRTWLLSSLGRFDDAKKLINAAIERDGANESLLSAMARVMRGQRHDAEATAWYAMTTAAHPDWYDLEEEYVQWLSAEGRAADAIDAARAALQRKPNDLAYMRRLSLTLMQFGTGAEIEEGIEFTKRTLEIAPDNPFAYFALASAYGRLERFEESEQAMRTAAKLAPNDWRIQQALGELLIGVGKAEEGAPILRAARQAGMRHQGAKKASTDSTESHR